MSEKQSPLSCVLFPPLWFFLMLLKRRYVPQFPVISERKVEVSVTRTLNFYYIFQVTSRFTHTLPRPPASADSSPLIFPSSSPGKPLWLFPFRRLLFVKLSRFKRKKKQYVQMLSVALFSSAENIKKLLFTASFGGVLNYLSLGSSPSYIPAPSLLHGAPPAPSEALGSRSPRLCLSVRERRSGTARSQPLPGAALPAKAFPRRLPVRPSEGRSSNPEHFYDVSLLFC